ncbi:MAG: AraC family transcriptional regulator [Verrucomicrobia bacterium]|nr:AraC family transcriptional regulator [Verrucomicrobiota bacterium]
MRGNVLSSGGGMLVSNPSIVRFVAEIVHTATVTIATHNDYIGSFSGARHRHDDLYQISYVLKGQIRVLLGNHCYSARAGDLFFIPSRRWHAFEPGEDKKRFNLLQIKFKTSHRLPLPFPIYIRLGHPVDIATGFHSIISEFHMRRPQREIMMRLDLARLVVRIHRWYFLKGREYRLPLPMDSLHMERCVEKAVRYIQANYSRHLCLSEMAGVSGCGVSTFAHTFKRNTGISPVSYLINYRLSKALDLMLHTERKLEDIASETGFSSVYYFSRLFRKRYHQSPRHYARLIYNAP